MDGYDTINQIANLICNQFFAGKQGLKGKIIKDLSTRTEDNLKNLLYTLDADSDYLHRVITQNEGKFRFPYGKFCYLLKVADRRTQRNGFDVCDLY